MNQYVFTSESVTEGHPDKLCDLISDCILDRCLEQDSKSRVAIDTMLSKDNVIIAGQITTKANINIEEIVRNTIKEVGYDNANLDLDYRTCKIDINITKQSENIAKGIETGGAGDQGIVFGYACDETPSYMPLGIEIAHMLTKTLTNVRKEKKILGLRPDGKAQVSVIYEQEIPKKITNILLSVQHEESKEIDVLRKELQEQVIDKVIDKKYISDTTKIYINPAGSFILGGPIADTGLTGRKIIVDTYGGYARHGGGAFSGKDATKIDRSAAYMLRHIAKNVVANKLARKCELQLSYAIGVEEPLSIYINTFGTNTIEEKVILEKIRTTFDLTPNGIIKYLGLEDAIFKITTNNGHFGNKNVSWEKVIKL